MTKHFVLLLCNLIHSKLGKEKEENINILSTKAISGRDSLFVFHSNAELVLRGEIISMQTEPFLDAMQDVGE